MKKFRVQKKEYVRKSIRFPRALFLELDSLSRAKGIPMGQLVTQCCRYALANMPHT